MNDMTQNLQAAGLNPIIINEDTDMSTLPTLNTPATPATPAQSSIERFTAGAKLLQKGFAKAEASDTALFNQRVEIQKLRDAVTDALGGKGDFDAASKAFKAANNKLDKMIDARDSTLRDAKEAIAALHAMLDVVADDLRDLED